MLFTISLQRRLHRGLKHNILHHLKNGNGINNPCVHCMDCACLFHKIYGYYNKGLGAYVQIITVFIRV